MLSCSLALLRWTLSLLAIFSYWSPLFRYFVFALFITLNFSVDSSLTFARALSSRLSLSSPRPYFRIHYLTIRYPASGRQLAAFVPSANSGLKSGVFVPGAFSPKNRKELKQAVQCATSSSGSPGGLVYTNPPARTVPYDRVLLPSAVCRMCEWLVWCGTRKISTINLLP